MNQLAMGRVGQDGRFRRRLAGAATILGGAVIFGVLAFFSIEFTRGSGRIAAVWVPNAVAIALLLRWKIPGEPLLLAGMAAANVSANLLQGDDLLRAAALAGCNTVEIVVALVLMRRLSPGRADMSNLRDLSCFVGIAGAVAPMVSATFASLALASSGGEPGHIWLKWAITDALGIILVAPAMMIFIDAAKRPSWPTPREAGEWVGLTIAGTWTTYAVFAQSSYPLLFLVAPIVVAHAFRLGSLGTAFSISKIAIIATVLTWSGYGPITLIDGTTGEQLIVLQAFLVAAFVVSLPVAAMLNRNAAVVEELESQTGQLSLLANNITDAVLRYDAEGICTYASPSVEDVLGTPVETFLGRKASSRMHEDAKTSIAAAESRLLSGESDNERFTYRRFLDDRNGGAVFIEADAALAINRETGEREGIIVSARNVTHRVKLEQQLVRARRHAENAAIAKSQFLANMSHEIRTPMNGVLGFVELLLQTDLTSDQRHYAELVQTSGDSMMRLLNDILDISKIEAGQIVLATEPLDLQHVLSSCVALQSTCASQRGLELVEHYSEDLPDRIVCDPLRLRQIVLNLLGNAVKFTEHGSVTLRTRRDGQSIAIEVSDTGIGIDDSRLDSIFNPFVQAEGHTSRRYGGTGLGLSISRRLATMLGGTLQAHSEIGKGSSFTLTIPLVEPDEAETSRPQKNTADPSRLIAGHRILLAEDHDINQVLVSSMLERCGQEVEIVDDGQKAVAAVMTAHSRGDPFDLVLMDVQMPECDGYTASRTIRSLGIDPDCLPIVALTANAFEEDRKAALKSGMQDHLAKPLQFGDLVAALQKWLDRAPATTDREDAPAPALPPHIAAPSTGRTALEAKWQERRSEALDAVAEALAQDGFTGADAEKLARLVHKLAGTAGMFGEAELGARAGALERALKGLETESGPKRLAEELLAAAA